LPNEPFLPRFIFDAAFAHGQTSQSSTFRNGRYTSSTIPDFIMDDLNVSVYGSTQAEWRRKLRKWMDCFIFERNKEKLLSKLLKTGMKNLAKECPHPPTWMKPLENGTSLSLDEMENRCIKNLIALAEMMESSAYMVAVGVRYWKYFLYDGKEVKTDKRSTPIELSFPSNLSHQMR
jgi:hypothetical protein